MCAESALPQLNISRAAVQSLESRVLMSAATLSNGVLNLVGDSNAGNAFTVDLGPGGTYYVNADNHILKPAASSVKSISISGGSGNDTVYINPSIKLAATINTFNGNDLIKAVGGNNTITTGDGNSTIYSSGNIHVGNGNNTVWASAASATIVGGNGKDLLIGGAGNDLLTVGAGPSTLIGGAGKGTFVASSATVISDKQSGESVTTTNSVPAQGGSATASNGSGTTSTNTPTTPGIVSAIITGTTLFVTGSSTSANNLSVDLQANGGLYANADNRTISTAPGVVKSIVITGGSASDSVWINPSIKVAATINTFGGNDLIKATGGYETVTTGDGSSTIYASGKITLGNGNNTVWAGASASNILAGNGNNLLVGGTGNDTIVAGSGRNTLIGGAGADVLTATSNSSFPDATSQDKVTKGTATGGTSTGGTTTTPPPVTGSGTPTLPSTPSAPSGTVKVSGENETVYGSNHGDSTAPTPVMVVLGLSGQAEQSVFVDALSSSLGSGTQLNATYKWTFGDPSGAYNTLVGWNAGHIYDKAGTYTISLTVTNVNGKSSSLSTTVTIGASTRKTIYVDSVAGNDSNNGLSPTSAVKSGIQASKLITDNTTVLFKRGQSFNSTYYFWIKSKNVVIGAYGSGANPIMMKQSSADHSIFYLSSTADQVVIENLTFDSVFKPVGNTANEIDAIGLFAAGRNVTVRNNTFLNVNTCVDATYAPVGMLLLNNTAPNIHGVRGYFEWMNGSEQVIAGNTVVNSTREHVMRSNFMTTNKILITDNNFANPTAGGGDSGDSAKTTVNIRAGYNVDIENNQLSQGTLSLGPDGLIPEASAVINTKINGNVMTNAQIQLHGSVQHAMVSNNKTDYSFYPDIIVQTIDPAYASRVMSDITIDHNTGILAGPRGYFLEVDGDKFKNIITVTNNLFAAPQFEPGANNAASVYVLANTAASIAWSNNNTFAPATGVMHLAPLAVNFIGLSPNILSNFLSSTQWNALPNVGTDNFKALSVSGSNLTTAGTGTFIGAILPAAI